jgi:succinate dehydrogenase / fumarate reductase cytochrome b subunit
MPGAAVKKKRPLWFNLSLLNLPVPGLVSILHRISGALLFLSMFWLLYLLEASLASQERYDAIRQTLAHPLSKLVLLALGWAFLHHLCAGIRYLFLDIHKGIDLPTARATGYTVIAVSLALTVLGGTLLW